MKVPTYTPSSPQEAPPPAYPAATRSPQYAPPQEYEAGTQETEATDTVDQQFSNTILDEVNLVL